MKDNGVFDLMNDPKNRMGRDAVSVYDISTLYYF